MRKSVTVQIFKDILVNTHYFMKLRVLMREAFRMKFGLLKSQIEENPHLSVAQEKAKEKSDTQFKKAVWMIVDNIVV